MVGCFLDFLYFFRIINAKILDNRIQEELGLLAERWHLSDLRNL
uniref:Uncharacterized protein n=1 Tax=Arundo donax TaxID=35708 RepID=A0A0A9F7N6_ARUDO